MKPLVTLILILSMCGLSACSGSTPTTKYYLLSDPYNVAAESIASDHVESCGTRPGRIAIAPYLQRNHIMLQDGTNELVPALQHRWSEPLEAGIERLLAVCLRGNQDLSEPVDVTVEHLHGDIDGNVVLQARWKTRTGGGRFSAVEQQRSSGYDALVTTQRALVLQLCADINAARTSCEENKPKEN